MNSEIQSARLYKTIAEVLNIPESDITDESSPDTIAAWDSVAQLNLVMAIEETFGLSFTPEETLEMTSVKLIRLTLEEKGA